VRTDACIGVAVEHKPACSPFTHLHAIMLAKIFALLFIFAGLVLNILGVVRTKEGLRSNEWPEVSARVQSAEVNKTRTKNGRYRHHARISYTYQVQGMDYTSNRVGLAGQGSGSESHANDLVKEYAPGKTVKAYHDPAHPGSAVLIRGVGSSIWLLFIVGVVFIVLGFYIMFSKRPARSPSPAT
jgi:hypothetical protein